jgi:hypothetical protein
MPLYYFHVRTDGGLVETRRGLIYPTCRLSSEALTSAAEFIAEAEWSGP